MEAVKETLKKRAEGMRKKAEFCDSEAARLRQDAVAEDEEAAQLRAEADEWDRVRIAMYGADEVAQ